MNVGFQFNDGKERLRIVCRGCFEFIANLEELPRLSNEAPFVFQSPGGFPFFAVSQIEAEEIRESKRLARERLSSLKDTQ